MRALYNTARAILITGVTRKQNTHVCVLGGKKCSFFGKFPVLCFLVTPVLRFVLLTYFRQNGPHSISC